MRQGNSYRIKNFATCVDTEVARLKAQVDLFWEKEHRCLQMFGLSDGMKILECGCGPGHVIEKLLCSFPSSEVTGVEIDPFLVQQSKERLAPFGTNRFHILEQSIMQMEFGDNSFDFVITRMVLEHLTDPLIAVREVYRVLKRGGKAVFVDNDFDMHLRAFPNIPELDELYAAYCNCRIAEGGKPRIGRELPRILQEGGFSNVDLEIVSAHSRLIGDMAFLKSEGSGIPAQLVKDGFLSRDALDRLARKWHETLKIQNHVFFRQLFVAVGEKLDTHTDQSKSDLEPMCPRNSFLQVPGMPTIFPVEKHLQVLTAYVQKRIGSLLEIEQDAIPVDHPIIGLGVDSFMSVELVNCFEKDFGITMSPVDILEADSIISVAARLNTEHDKPGCLSPMLTAGLENQIFKSGEQSSWDEYGARSQSEKEWEEGEI